MLQGNTLHWPSILTIIGFAVTWAGVFVSIGYYKATVDGLKGEVDKLRTDLAKKQNQDYCEMKHEEATGIAREFAQTVNASFQRMEGQVADLRKELNAGLNAIRVETNDRFEVLQGQIVELLKVMAASRRDRGGNFMDNNP